MQDVKSINGGKLFITVVVAILMLIATVVSAYALNMNTVTISGVSTSASGSAVIRPNSTLYGWCNASSIYPVGYQYSWYLNGALNSTSNESAGYYEQRRGSAYSDNVVGSFGDNYWGGGNHFDTCTASNSDTYYMNYTKPSLPAGVSFVNGSYYRYGFYDTGSGSVNSYDVYEQSFPDCFAQSTIQFKAVTTQYLGNTLYCYNGTDFMYVANMSGSGQISRACEDSMFWNLTRVLHDPYYNKTDSHDPYLGADLLDTKSAAQEGQTWTFQCVPYDNSGSASQMNYTSSIVFFVESFNATSPYTQYWRNGHYNLLGSMQAQGEQFILNDSALGNYVQILNVSFKVYRADQINDGSTVQVNIYEANGSTPTGVSLAKGTILSSSIPNSSSCSDAPRVTIDLLPNSLEKGKSYVAVFSKDGGSTPPASTMLFGCFQSASYSADDIPNSLGVFKVEERNYWEWGNTTSNGGPYFKEMDLLMYYESTNYSNITYPPPYCYNYPNAYFCDDAESGNISQKYTFVGDPGYEAYYSSVDPIDGAYSIVLNWSGSGFAWLETYQKFNISNEDYPFVARSEFYDYNNPADTATMELGGVGIYVSGTGVYGPGSTLVANRTLGLHTFEIRYLNITYSEVYYDGGLVSTTEANTLDWFNTYGTDLMFDGGSTNSTMHTYVKRDKILVERLPMNGSGTLGDPYQVAYCGQLQDIGLVPSAYYVLANDIDCTDTLNWNAEIGFIPISSFSGSLDGRGHSIIGFYSNLASSNAMIFALTGTIKNVHFVNVSMFDIEANNVGVIAVEHSGWIDNVSVTGTVIGQGNTGGLVSQNYGVISNSSFSGTIKPTNVGHWAYGGLAGYSEGQIIDSYADVFIDVGTSYLDADAVGGLVGEDYGTIVRSYSKGFVFGDPDDSQYVGGLVGYGTTSISDSYSTANVTGTDSVGGLYGYVDAGGVIDNTYSTGFVSSASNVGGLIGFDNGGTITDSFWDNETSGQTTSAAGTGLSTFEMKARSTYTDAGWDFVNTWEMIDYPHLQWEGLYLLNGSGTDVDPYQVYDCVDFQNINLFAPLSGGEINQTFALMNNIDCSDTVNWNAGAGFDPIGSLQGMDVFSGKLLGKGYTIDGLYLYYPSGGKSKTGIFHDITGSAEIRDVKFTNVNITANWAGAVVGQVTGSGGARIYNVSVVGGGVSGGSYSAGLVAYTQVSDFIIDHCYTDLVIQNRTSLTMAGGLAGQIPGLINNSHSSSILTGGQDVGGLQGKGIGINYNQTNIQNSYFDGEVYGTNAGGLIGYLGPGGGAAIRNSYSAAKVISGTTKGGIATGTFTGNECVGVYYDSDLVGLSDTNCGAVPKKTNYLLSQSTFSGWDFTNAWEMIDYPRLQWEGLSRSDYSNGLIARYYLDEQSGTAADSSGKGYDLLEYGASTPSNSFGRLFSDDDGDGYLRANLTGVDILSEGFTMTMQIRAESSMETIYYVLNDYDPGFEGVPASNFSNFYYKGFGIGTEGIRGQIGQYNYGNDPVTDGINDQYVAGEVHTITLTYDVSALEARIYEDGVYKFNSSMNPWIINLTTIVLGHQENDYSDNYSVRNVALWNRTLNDTEVAHISGAFARRVKVPLSCYDFNDNLADYFGVQDAVVSGTDNYNVGKMFRGVETYMNSGDTSEHPQLNNYWPSDGVATIEFWARVDARDGLGSAIFSKHDQITALYVQVDSSNYIRFGINNASGILYEAVATGNYVDSSWHHYVMVFNGTSVKSYLDGVYVANTSGTEDIGSTAYFNNYTLETWLGTFASGYDMDGRFDSVKIYTVALNTSDISYLYNSGNGRTCQYSEINSQPVGLFQRFDYNPDTRDCITPTVCLARSNGGGGLWNGLSETDYDFTYYSSPLGVLWAHGTCGDSGLVFSKFSEALDSQVGNNILSYNLCAYFVNEDKYVDFDFLSWTIGGAGGGFSYNRSGLMNRQPAQGSIVNTKYRVSAPDYNNVGSVVTYQPELIIQNESYGKIVIQELSGMNISGYDFDANLFMANNLVGMNPSGLPGLGNVSAKITIVAPGFTSPVVLKDGVPCSRGDCGGLSYNGVNAVFTVQGFSNYSLANCTDGLLCGLVEYWDMNTNGAVLVGRQGNYNLTAYGTPIYMNNASCAGQGCYVVAGSGGAGDVVGSFSTYDRANPSSMNLSQQDDTCIVFWGTISNETTGLWYYSLSEATYGDPFGISVQIGDVVPGLKTIKTEGPPGYDYSRTVNSMGASQVGDGLLHHFAFCEHSDSGNHLAYMDGVLVLNETLTPWTSAAQLVLNFVGNAPRTAGEFNYGTASNTTIDEVAVYRRLLNATEVAYLASGYNPYGELVNPPTFCDNYPLAYFCDDAETGNIQDKWILDDIGQGYSCLGGGCNYTSVAFYNGSKSIMYSDPSYGNDVLMLNMTGLSSIWNISFKTKSNLTGTTDRIHLMLASTQPGDVYAPDAGDIAFADDCFDHCTPVDTWYDVNIYTDGVNVFYSYANVSSNYSLVVNPHWLSFGNENGGNTIYIDDFLIQSYTPPTFCQVNNGSNVVLCDDAESGNLTDKWNWVDAGCGYTTNASKEGTRSIYLIDVPFVSDCSFAKQGTGTYNVSFPYVLNYSFFIPNWQDWSPKDNMYNSAGFSNIIGENTELVLFGNSYVVGGLTSIVLNGSQFNVSNSSWNDVSLYVWNETHANVTINAITQEVNNLAQGSSFALNGTGYQSVYFYLFSENTSTPMYVDNILLEKIIQNYTAPASLTWNCSGTEYIDYTVQNNSAGLLGGSYIYTFKEGMRFNATRNSTGLKATKFSNSDYTRAYLYDSGYSTILENVSVVGNDAVFAYNLTEGQTYYVMWDKEGSSYQETYESFNTPYLGNNVDWLSYYRPGLDSGNVYSIGTYALTTCSVVPPSSFFDDFNRPDNATLGNGWTELSGQNGFEILNNQLIAQGMRGIIDNPAALGDWFSIQWINASNVPFGGWAEIDVQNDAGNLTLAFSHQPYYYSGLFAYFDGASWITCGAVANITPGYYLAVHKIAPYEMMYGPDVNNMVNVCNISTTLDYAWTAGRIALDFAPNATIVDNVCVADNLSLCIPAPVLFLDRFNRSDTATVDNGWVEYPGRESWDVVNQTLYNDGSGWGEIGLWSNQSTGRYDGVKLGSGNMSTFRINAFTQSLGMYVRFIDSNTLQYYASSGPGWVTCGDYNYIENDWLFIDTLTQRLLIKNTGGESTICTMNITHPNTLYDAGYHQLEASQGGSTPKTIYAFCSADNMTDCDNFTQPLASPVAEWKFNEVSGSNVFNSIDANFNGTAYGTTIVPGWDGYARYFNGTSYYSGDYVKTDLRINLTNGFTLVARVKFAGAPNARSIAGADTTNCGIGDKVCVSFAINEFDKFSIDMRDGQTPNNFVGVGAEYNCSGITENEYHFVAFTYDNVDKSTEIYVDGQYCGYKQNLNFNLSNYENTSYLLDIGRANKEGYFNGAIDQVRVYNQKLSVVDLDYLYNETGIPAYSYYYLHYYKLDGNSNDEFGLINGTDIGFVGNTTGVFNYARRYNASGLTQINVSRLSNNSVSLWFKVDGPTTWSIAAWGYSQGSCGGSDLWQFAHNGSHVSTNIDCGWTTLYSDNPVPFGGWHHAVFNYDSGIQTWYLDGVLQSSNANYVQPMSPFFYLGGDHTWSGDYYADNVSIDELTFFNGTRSQAQVNELYGAGINLTNGLKVFYNFEGLNDAFGVYDMTGYGFVAPATETGVVGNAKYYNRGSSNNSVLSYSLDNAYAQVGTGDFTANMWIKLNENLTNNGVFYISGVDPFDMYTYYPNVVIRHCDYVSCGGSWGSPVGNYLYASVYNPTDTYGQAVNSIQELNLSQWYMVTLTRKDGVLTIYLNGVNDTTNSNSNGPTANLSYGSPVKAGFNSYGPNPGGDSLNFTVDLFGFWNRSLSDAEITALYSAGSLVNDSNLAEDMIGYWGFNELGTDVVDTSSRGNNGTAVNGVSPVTGKNGLGKGFVHESNQYISFADDYNIGVSNLTVSFWFKNNTAPRGDGVGQYIIGKAEPLSPYESWAVQFQDQGDASMQCGVMFFTVNDGGYDLITPDAPIKVCDGGWVHVVIVYNGTAALIYKNGVLENITQASVPYTNLSSTAQFTIGARSDGGTVQFLGAELDEVAIWSRPLSLGDVLRLYNEGNGVTYNGTDFMYLAPASPPVYLTNFTATPDMIRKPYSTVVLSWDAYEADLDLNGINVTGLTSYNVTPAVNTTYTLTASNENGTTNSSLTVVVTGTVMTCSDFDGSISTGDYFLFENCDISSDQSLYGNLAIDCNGTEINVSSTSGDVFLMAADAGQKNLTGCTFTGTVPRLNSLIYTDVADLVLIGNTIRGFNLTYAGPYSFITIDNGASTSEIVVNNTFEDIVGNLTANSLFRVIGVNSEFTGNTFRNLRNLRVINVEGGQTNIQYNLYDNVTAPVNRTSTIAQDIHTMIYNANNSIFSNNILMVTGYLSTGGSYGFQVKNNYFADTPLGLDLYITQIDTLDSVVDNNTFIYNYPMTFAPPFGNYPGTSLGCVFTNNRMIANYTDAYDGRVRYDGLWNEGAFTCSNPLMENNTLLGGALFYSLYPGFTAPVNLVVRNNNWTMAYSVNSTAAKNFQLLSLASARYSDITVDFYNNSITQIEQVYDLPSGVAVQSRDGVKSIMLFHNNTVDVPIFTISGRKPAAGTYLPSLQVYDNTFIGLNDVIIRAFNDSFNNESSIPYYSLSNNQWGNPTFNVLPGYNSPATKRPIPAFGFVGTDLYNQSSGQILNTYPAPNNFPTNNTLMDFNTVVLAPEDIYVDRAFNITVRNLKIANSYGSIMPAEVTLKGVNSSYVFISYNLVGIDSVALPQFQGLSANLTLNVEGLVSPKILKDGVVCGANCTGVTYNGTTVFFTVSGFSNYSATNGSYCNDDFDCGSCQKCSANVCTYQNSTEDVKSECAVGVSCTNAYTYLTASDYCNGAGACGNTSTHVSVGNICINSTSYDSDPTSAAYCGIWSDCVLHQTSAAEYYVGYAASGSSCNETDWQAAGTYQNATPGYWWTVTAKQDTCSETSYCVNDSECGSCQKCNAGVCGYQNTTEDTKAECTGGIYSCSNPYTYSLTSDYCNGAGACGSTSTHVSAGNVCINSTDYNSNPTSSVYCGIWSDCVLHQTSAAEYYVGYAASGSSCVATDWQATGTYQNATAGYWWSATVQQDTCPEVYVCTNDTDCGACQKCNAGVCGYQNSTEDTKGECTGGIYSCANPYTYSLTSDYCNGAGACGSASTHVSAGKVCINSTDYNAAPTSTNKCGTWSDCVIYGTSADEYYVGYAATGTSCNDTSWVAAGSYQNSTPGYRWSFTAHTDTCSEELYCTNDTQCGTCKLCNVTLGTCYNEPVLTDTKDDCTAGLSGCANIAVKSGPNGYCNGYGACDTSSNTVNVAAGKVCLAGADADPSASAYCGIWSDCVYHGTTASEYYVGVTGVGTTQCTDTNWQPTGTSQNASGGYWWAATGHFDQCLPEISGQCAVDSDCGPCKVCGGNFTCVNELATEDIKNDCTEGFNACYDDYTRMGPNGLCNGAGSCDTNSNRQNVSENRICYNGQDKLPCGFWDYCLSHGTQADRYATGVIENVGGNDVCIETGWVAFGYSYPTAGYYWATTELKEASGTSNQCAQIPIPGYCFSDGECGFCNKCVDGACVNETSAEDVKNECAADSCFNDYTFYGSNKTGFCDGAGACKENNGAGVYSNVSIGKVCVNGSNALASASVNCGLWSSCSPGSQTANEYWVGFIGDGTATCVSNYWVSSGTIQNVTPQYIVSNGAMDTCSAAECNSNADCGLCEKCSAGTCVNQTYTEDLKNECTVAYDSCLTPYIRQSSFGSGYCSGLGACDNSTTGYKDVTAGNVCIGGNDTAPTAGVHCDDKWSDCVRYATTANEYYVGFTGTGTNTCDASNWQSAGTQQTTGSGYWDTTGRFPDCNVVSCAQDTDCGFCQKCDAGACVMQNASEDTKDQCNIQYSSCTNAWTLHGSDSTGFCNGAGACNMTGDPNADANVTIGNVCQNGNDTQPNPTVHCGIWSNCQLHAITAPEYYVGYRGNGSNVCVSTDWKYTGTNQTAAYRMWWSMFGYMDDCPEERACSLPRTGTITYGVYPAYDDCYIDNLDFENNIIIDCHGFGLIKNGTSNSMLDMMNNRNVSIYNCAINETASGRQPLYLSNAQDILLTNCTYLYEDTPSSDLAYVHNSSLALRYSRFSDLVMDIDGASVVDYAYNTVNESGAQFIRLTSNGGTSSMFMHDSNFTAQTMHFTIKRTVAGDNFTVYFYNNTVTSDHVYYPLFGDSMTMPNVADFFSNRYYVGIVELWPAISDPMATLYDINLTGWFGNSNDLFTNKVNLNVTNTMVSSGNATANRRLIGDGLMLYDTYLESTANLTLTGFVFNNSIYDFGNGTYINNTILYVAPEDIVVPDAEMYPFEATPASTDVSASITDLYANVTNMTLTLKHTDLGTQRSAVCNVSSEVCRLTLQYYDPAGNYSYSNVTVTDRFGKTPDYTLSTGLVYTELNAISKDRDYVTFSGTLIGLPNVQCDIPVRIFNAGNRNVINITMTAYNLSGTTYPQYQIPATAFRAGGSLASSVPLLEGVPVVVPLALNAETNSFVDLRIWVSVANTTYPQTYTPLRTWNLTMS